MFSPTHLYYLASLRCNERCSKCSHWKVDEHASQAPSSSIIDAIHKLSSLKEFCIVGGEPLVNKKRVIELLKGIASTQVRTVLITNGVACTPKFIDQVKDCNLHIIFSIDTVDPIFWRHVRGTDSYYRVMRHFRYAVKTLAPEQLSVQSVLAEETVEHVRAVGEMCHKLGRFHSVQNYIQQGFEGEWTELPASRSAPVPFGQCNATGRNLSIMPDGSVYTCFQQPLIPGCGHPLGKIGELSILSMLSTQYAENVLKCMRTCNLPCKTLKCNQ
ncbi:radical SAM protein [Pseudodesulfovibrio sp. zrk46]|nr:radical SAM protein [Pseudodesulfovibrio sp. zrk46]